MPGGGGGRRTRIGVLDVPLTGVKNAVLEPFRALSPKECPTKKYDRRYLKINFTSRSYLK